MPGETEQRTYKIGEVAELLRLKTSVLRFWETEFPQIAPLRTDKGIRIYTEEHLEILRKIRQLLHVDGMTIEGARRIMDRDEEESCAADRHREEETDLINYIKKDLLKIRDILSSSEKGIQ